MARYGQTSQDIGLALLATTGAFGVWSASNTSYVGHIQFGLENPEAARRGMNMGIGFVAALAIGILALYGRKAVGAAIGAAAVGGLLYYIYDVPLRDAERKRLVRGGMGT